MAAYVPIGSGLWRRVYPETFYATDSFISPRKLEYIDHVYKIFRAVIDGQRRSIIEDEINLMYMEIERRAASGEFSEDVLSVVQRRLDLKKQAIQNIEALALDVESKFPVLAQTPPHIRFRMESTVYLVRLLAYGLFADNDIVLERVSEVFDVAKLQTTTKPRERRQMDSTLKFLYRGLIQKNERGRQGSRHAAKHTLTALKKWYPDNEYVIMCIEKIGKYM